MNLWLLLPLLIPFFTAVATLLAWQQPKTQRALNVVGATALLLAGVGLLTSVQQGGIQAVQMGGWQAPYGITLVADLFSAIMVLLTGLMGVTIAVYSLTSIDNKRVAFGYYPLLHFLLMGVCGAFLTGDLFNLYVWFEVMLIASFVLLALGGERAQLEGAVKYVTLNLIASAIFLAAVGILYGIAGTLNLADLARRLSIIGDQELVYVAAMLLLIAFGVKAALFPLFFWLPASYHTPPIAVTALFSGLLTKVGVYSLMRVFTLVFVEQMAATTYLQPLLLTLAGLTMVTGVLGAVAQYEVRRLLSFHIISQIGYLLMGLGLYSVAALAGAIFFMAHVILAKSALFLISGIVQQLQGTYQLKLQGGLYRTHPTLALLFLVPALSLAGLPPFSGFFAKLALVRAGLSQGEFVIIAVALGVSILTLFSMIKIWTEAFWKEAPPPTAPGKGGKAQPRPIGVSLVAPVLLLALLSIVIGVAAEPLFGLATRAAEQLMTPTGYLQAVLGETPP